MFNNEQNLDYLSLIIYIICSRGEHMWVVVKTKPNQEQRAKINLENQGFDTYLPLLRQKKFYRGKWIDFNEVMFKGYIFIKKNHAFCNLHKIKNTYGVINLLLDKTTAIPYEVDESELIEVIDIVETNNSGFKEGDNVIYTKGINSKIIGILKNKLNNNRAILILSILGKNQEVSVSLNNLQKII